MAEFNLIAVLVSWANSLFGANIPVEASATEFADAFKEAAEKTMADLKTQIETLTAQAGAVASQATALETLQASVAAMSEQIKTLNDNAATAKADYEAQIKTLRDSFTKQMAGEGQQEEQEHAFAKESGSSKSKRIVLEGWGKKNEIVKTSIN